MDNLAWQSRGLGVGHVDFAQRNAMGMPIDRGNVPSVTPIGPAAGRMQKPAASLLPDQEFIPINTDAPSMDSMRVYGDFPFTASSLFSSPFPMFGGPGPVPGYGPNMPHPQGARGGRLGEMTADSMMGHHLATRPPQ